MFRLSHACVASFGQVLLKRLCYYYPHRQFHARVRSSTLSCGPDTAHVTYKEGTGRSPAELASLLEEFQRQYELPSSAVVTDRGLSGFAGAAIDQAAGLRLDWTRAGEEGANPGTFCLQVKGTWFENADGETAADFLQLLQAYGPYRVTRLDIQQTIATTQRLTPWWVSRFESGQFRVVGKKHYEPRGKKTADGDFPLGATLYHGSRSSERFARQYDKHLQQASGEPRRRDEIEIKGQSARDLWADLHKELLATEQLGTSRGATLHTFSKRSLRAFLPIRDCSRWLGKPLPRNWTQMAPEPTTWANLFDADPITVKPRERRLSTLLKSYRYGTTNFGAAISAMTALRIQEELDAGRPEELAAQNAYARTLDDCTLAANEDRVREFLNDLPKTQRDQAMGHWLEMLRTSASNLETERD